MVRSRILSPCRRAGDRHESRPGLVAQALDDCEFRVPRRSGVWNGGAFDFPLRPQSSRELRRFGK